MNKLLYIYSKFSIYAVVFLVPLIWSLNSLEFNKQHALAVLVFTGTIAWFLRMILKDRELRFIKNPLNIPVLAFLLASALSILFSVDRIASILGSYGRFSDSFIGILSLVGLYFLITNLITTKEEVKKILSTLFFSSMVIVFISYLSIFNIWQKFEFLPNIMKQVSFSMVSESLEGLAIFIVVVIVLLLSQKISFKKPLELILLISSFGLLVLIDFNIAWIILLVSILSFILISIWQNMRAGKAAQHITAVIMFSVALFFLVSSITFVKDSPKEEILDFETSWSISLNTVSDNVKNMAFGSGIGTYSIDFSEHKPESFNHTSLWQERFDKSGNYISELFATIGALGFIAYVTLIAMLFAVIAIVFKSSFAKKNKQEIAVQTVLAAIALLIAQFLFYHNTVLALLFWLMISLTIVSLGLPRREITISLKKLPNIIVKFIFLLFILLIAGFMFVIINSYMADINYVKSQEGTNTAQKIRAGLKAITLNPIQSEYRIGLSNLYISRVLEELKKPFDQQDQSLISTDVQKALAYAKGGEIEGVKIIGAVEISPNRVSMWEALGTAYRDIQFAQGALDWGITAFQRAIALEPLNPVLRTELGSLYVVKEEFDLAKKEFEKAIELNPNYLPVQFQRALLYEKEGDDKTAILMLEKLAIRNFSIDTLFQLGRLYYNTGSIDESIVQFQKIIQAVPNHSNAYYSLGLAYEKQGKINEAKVAFQHVLQLNPENEAIQKKLNKL